MNERTLLQPATTADVWEMQAAFNRSLDKKLATLCTSHHSLSQVPDSALSHHGLLPPRHFTGPPQMPLSQSTTPLASPMPYHLVESTAPSPASVPAPTVPQPLPIQEAVIPNLPRGEKGWREAIHQWEEADPSTGRPPLRDWPPSWYTGKMREKTAVKRTQRRYVAEEYDRCVIVSHFVASSCQCLCRCGRDDKRFLETFPQAKEGMKALLKAILRQRITRNDAKPRNSKNGSPEERSSAPSTDRESE